MQKSAKRSINLRMSAKNSNFAPQNDENMTIETMTHTQSRCRHSYYTLDKYDKSRACECTRRGVRCTPDECKICKLWQPHDVAISFFAGTLRGDMYYTIKGIYEDRMKRGEW